MRRRHVILILCLLATAGLVVPRAGAGHRFGGHWRDAGGEVNVRFIDSAQDSWTTVMLAAAAEWSESDAVNAVIEPGSDARDVRRKCPPATGAVRICNFNYGATGWVGYTTAVVKGKHFVRVSIKLNSTYLGKKNRKVMCHEMGHGLGLGHRAEPSSCMKQGSAQAHPDGHDYRMLERIYSHSHALAAETADDSEEVRVIRIPTPVDAR